MGGRQCGAAAADPDWNNELSLIDQDIEHYKMSFPPVCTRSPERLSKFKRRRQKSLEEKEGNEGDAKEMFGLPETRGLEKDGRGLDEPFPAHARAKTAAEEKLKTLMPQTLELLKKMIIAEDEEDKKEKEKEMAEKKEKELAPNGERSPSRRASRVSPLPPIEEEEGHLAIEVRTRQEFSPTGSKQHVDISLHFGGNEAWRSELTDPSPEGEEVRAWMHPMPNLVQPIPQHHNGDMESRLHTSPDSNALNSDSCSPDYPELLDFHPGFEGGVDNGERELEVNEERVEEGKGSVDGESCYGSMASLDSADKLDAPPAAPSGDGDGADETSPSSDEMNLECRNALYGNRRVAKSCQEVSHWLLNYTQEPMRKSASLDREMKSGATTTATAKRVCNGTTSGRGTLEPEVMMDSTGSDELDLGAEPLGAALALGFRGPCSLRAELLENTAPGAPGSPASSRSAEPLGFWTPESRFSPGSVRLDTDPLDSALVPPGSPAGIERDHTDSSVAAPGSPGFTRVDPEPLGFRALAGPGSPGEDVAGAAAPGSPASRGDSPSPSPPGSPGSSSSRMIGYTTTFPSGWDCSATADDEQFISADGT